MAVCEVCFRHCDIEEGKFGFCKARTCKDGKVVAYNYGLISSLALDPIEKKPLRRFYPGSNIISVGSFGCNLHCPFCQNYEISWSREAELMARRAERISPEELVMIASRYKEKGNIGIAYTYNEPLIGYEFVRDCAKLVHEAGMKNVLVSNGMVELKILKEIIPYIDAMNIDLKGFTDEYYAKLLKGNRKQVMAFIEEAVKHCHVELTNLIIPDENDSEEEMRRLSGWIASLDRSIPLHISRFFPCFHMTDKDPTDVEHIYKLAEIAREQLEFVYTGNC
ncbi:MAG: AmmeMemoRadiSam system radical SAM enzyme [Erysipelotrichaceae bacterium]|nr:AmmeMemoRadiSam system radical SAM enzyme [Erysipelotrichaceae bacterium]MBQ6494337.1 AmmeMemoRadiSam system radical SAM enzyme [Erysipelotrichaceae bacterium]